jgi:hypothetical protein
VSGADYNGDGRADLVVNVNNHGLDIWFGGQEDPDPAITIYGQGWGGQLYTGKDLDGDGIADLSGGIIGPGWMSGLDLAEGNGATDLDLLSGWLTPVSDPESDIPIGIDSTALLAVDDWSGDGAVDLIVVSPGSSSGSYGGGEVFLLDGAPEGEIVLADALGSIVGEYERQGIGYLATTGDLDGDDVDELILRDTSANWHLISIADSPPGPRTQMADARVLSIADANVWLSAHGDLNNDGRDDIAMTVSREGCVRLLYGWDIPWDQEEYW